VRQYCLIIFFSALAGATWYFQSFFYTMGVHHERNANGPPQVFELDLHVASMMIFSTLWGIALKEWKGAGLRTRTTVALSLFVLIASIVVVDYGNYFGTRGAPPRGYPHKQVGSVPLRSGGSA
jgi:L-rhamnose-H+ transport protein